MEIINRTTPGLLGRVLTDVIALGVSYLLSFIGCDLIFNHFRIQQSLKSAYWFLLGPFLWRWGTALPWLYKLLKNLLNGVWQSIEEDLLDWLENKKLITTFTTRSLRRNISQSVDKQGPAMIENFNYLRNDLLKYEHTQRKTTPE